jgi:hypothetical protein
MDSAKTSREDGRKFGKLVEQQACVGSAKKRIAENGGITGGITASLFLDGCLETAAPTPGLCDDVPPESEIMKSVQWRMNQCKDFSGNKNDCQNIMAPVQRFCDSQSKKNK